MKGWLTGQHYLAIAARMQRVAMMIGVAHGVFVVIPPTKQAENSQEHRIQPWRLEHRAMAELVNRRDREERADRSVHEQGDSEAGPQCVGKAVVRGNSGAAERDEMPARQEPSTSVASLQQPEHGGARYRAPVPVNVEGISYAA